MSEPTSIVLLHTWGGDARTWGPVLPFLDMGPGRRLVVPDLPGHGSRRAESFTLDAATAAVDAAISGTATGSTAAGVDLVGAGLGAAIALAYTRSVAGTHPARVRSLTLAGFPPVTGAEAEERLRHTRTRLAAIGAATFAAGYVAQTLRTAAADRRRLLCEAMAATSAETLVATLATTLDWDRADPPGDSGHRLPTLVLRGADDDRVSEAAATRLAAALGGTARAVPDAGHVAYLDEPRAFAAAIVAFHASVANGSTIDARLTYPTA
ncbi:alpha/beta hydrolase [Micromonospora sp. NBC_01699]|uniref:alpha/beta fold hydrolase n=1 Tax=Micromonospora sp. NBC_01699 TaxID=2975984 RepID=UPI002E2E42A6|nr:alpha/beta hydrolase [Micromonospora sp. NBC_01699]